MVLESIVVPAEWEKHPGRMFFIGFTYSTVGIFLAYFVFGDYASLSAIFLSTIPLVVIMNKALLSEEGKDINILKELSLLWEHTYVLAFFMFLFIGIVISFCFWFTILPPDMVSSLFSYQSEIIDSVNAVRASGAFYSSSETLSLIISNNLVVLGFCILFSFLYGSGAIFILTMNASILGALMGSVISSGAKTLAEYGNNSFVLNYVSVLPYAMKYLVHGVPEMLSYFIGALAGGILSASLIRHHHKSPEFKKILFDVAVLTSTSIILLVISAIIEVYLTPYLI
jgi:uncharacterized membrane protein SpoIIM required for sporulation